MSRYLSIRFELVWAFSSDGPFVQILDHVYYLRSYEGRLVSYIATLVARRYVTICDYL